MWLCLVCGNLGCGRSQFGGIGGNGHGLAHFESTKHAVAVKMGSITPEGTADVFCYEHGNEILNPNLGLHLKSFGINIESQEKTEKSIAEMQLEQNLKFDFNMTSADGKELEPLYGPGLTGIKNLGNSCYMASVVQVLFSIPEILNFYSNTFEIHAQGCHEPPANCFRCQMGKMGDGLLSGRYSSPNSSISPSMFKDLVGKGNPEFQSMRQQVRDLIGCPRIFAIPGNQNYPIGTLSKCKPN